MQWQGYARGIYEISHIFKICYVSFYICVNEDYIWAELQEFLQIYAYAVEYNSAYCMDDGNDKQEEPRNSPCI